MAQLFLAIRNLQNKRYTTFLLIGMIESKHWTAVVTCHNESIRIFAVRRSRNKEVTLYESEQF
ncbi:MAG: hypothetical protein WBS20_07020 [Lysobacterales bacterium]